MDYGPLVRLLAATDVFRCDHVTYALGRDPRWIRKQLEGVQDVDLEAINETSIGNLLHCFRFAMEPERQTIGALLTSVLERIHERHETPTGHDSA